MSPAAVLALAEARLSLDLLPPILMDEKQHSNPFWGSRHLSALCSASHKDQNSRKYLS